MNLIKNLFAVAAVASTVAFVGCKEEVINNGLCVENTPTCTTEQYLDVTTCTCVDKPVATVETVNKSGLISADETWTADKIYVLSNKVVVTEGVTLTIEAGTIVKGKNGAGSLASALVVARGGKIMANGTAEKPVIFTAEADNITVGQTMGTNLTEADNKLWGGVIVLGNAPISAEDGDTEANIEGIPADDGFGLFGGDNAADNSGVLNYVSIRHGGQLIGEGNEINGLTLGGVGNGTTVENIEVFGNLDDGVEFFGGTVNATNVVVAYQGDDAIDIDMNYSGTVKNAYIVHGGDDTDEAFEIDGPENATYTDGLFTIENATAVAMDQTKTSAGDFKSKAQGTVKNVAFKGYKKGVKVRANFGDECASKTDAYTNVIDGKLTFMSSEIEGADFAAGTVYTKKECSVDALQAPLAEKLEGGLSVVSSASTGADTSVFAWTVTNAKGLVK